MIGGCERSCETEKNKGSEQFWRGNNNAVEKGCVENWKCNRRSVLDYHKSSRFSNRGPYRGGTGDPVFVKSSWKKAELVVWFQVGVGYWLTLR